MNTIYNDLQKQLTAKTISLADITSKANSFLSENNIQKAYPYIKTIAYSPGSSDADKMTAGLIAVSLKFCDEAAELFTLIINEDASNFDAQYNLALLEIERKNFKNAYTILEKLSQLQPNSIDLLNDLAVISTYLADTEKAFTHWQKVLDIDPHNSLYRNNALAYSLENNFFKEANQLLQLNEKSSGNNSKTKTEIHRWFKILHEKKTNETTTTTVLNSQQISGKKIAFFSSIDSFVGDIIEHLKLSNEVKIFDNSNLNEMKSLIEWADISWFEWCDQFLVEATKFEKTSQIVCRLHSYEAFTDFPLQVDWQKVDLLIFVNKSVQELVTNKIQIETPQVIVHNAVDIQKFQFPKNKKQNKKIGSVGYINYKKNPELLLYCFKKIYDYDSEYSLHIAGQHQDPRIKLYFEHFISENNLPVYFDGWVDDMPKWYADKNFVISTSLFESFHYSIAEGMASGVLPLIHNWYGAKLIYPEKYIYNTPDDCLTMVQNLEKISIKQLRIENRNFIIKSYNKEDKMHEISSQLYNLVKDKELVGIG